MPSPALGATVVLSHLTSPTLFPTFSFPNVLYIPTKLWHLLLWIGGGQNHNLYFLTSVILPKQFLFLEIPFGLSVMANSYLKIQFKCHPFIKLLFNFWYYKQILSPVKSHSLFLGHPNGYRCAYMQIIHEINIYTHIYYTMCIMSYSTAAKSLQSCPTLCDPMDGSPPGSPIPGILKVRTLEWVAISFSNVWNWNV